MRLFLVSAKNGDFIGFTNRSDAYRASGDMSINMFDGCNTNVVNFRETNAYEQPRKKFPVLEIELNEAQIKVAKIKVKKNAASRS